VSPSEARKVVQYACDKMRALCSELAWIFMRGMKFFARNIETMAQTLGYGGAIKNVPIAKKYSRKACQFGDFIGCIMYCYLREGKDFPLSLPPPHFTDIKSNQLYLKLLKKSKTAMIPYEDIAKGHVTHFYSLSNSEYTTREREKI
jgi:hypothetical protein